MTKYRDTKKDIAGYIFFHFSILQPHHSGLSLCYLFSAICVRALCLHYQLPMAVFLLSIYDLNQGNVSSATNRTKLDCRISKDVVNRSQKPNPSVCREIKRKEDVSLASGKRITSKTSSNIKSDRVQSRKQLSEVQSSATVLRASLKTDKMVSLSSNMRGSLRKTSSTPKSLADRLPSTSSVITRSAQVDRLVCVRFGVPVLSAC